MDTMLMLRGPAAPATADGLGFNHDAMLSEALLNDFRAHADNAYAAHDWAVKQLTGVIGVTGLYAGYAFVDAKKYPTAESAERLIDDVHRLMPMYDAAMALRDVFPCKGHVTVGGEAYLMVTDAVAAKDAIESLLGPEFRVETRGHMPFPVVTLDIWQ